MPSDFRRQKLLHLFRGFDISKSGTIDKKDFEYAIDSINTRRGLKPEDAKYKELNDTLWKIWEVIKSRADTDNDDEVSVEEWMKMWDDFSKDPAGASEWQSTYAKFVFLVQDVNGDGEIDEQEFVPVAMSFGIEKDNAEEAFRRFTKGKQKVTWSAFLELWDEYVNTEDPEAPGNFIFGMYKSDS